MGISRFAERFDNFILRLGRVHSLMNFIRCVGTLMTDSGLSDVMECAFGGVASILSGKRFPQKFRALRMVLEEFLHSLLYIPVEFRPLESEFMTTCYEIRRCLCIDT